MTVRSGGDDANVVGVLDGGENSSGKNELLPSLSDVDEVDACREREREPKGGLFRKSDILHATVSHFRSTPESPIEKRKIQKDIPSARLFQT